MMSWIVNLIVGNIPVWIWPVLAGAGAGVYFVVGFLSRLPQIKPWALIIRPLAVILCLFGVFMSGGSGVTSIYQNEIKDMQAKVKATEAQSQETNTVIQKVYVDRVKIIHDNKQAVQARIQTAKTQLDATCKITPDVVSILNQAAGGQQ